jgi:hypothetical protein
MTDETKTLKSIVHHRIWVRAGLQAIIHELEKRALLHDESKFRDDEFVGFARINHIARDHKYGSDEYRQSLKDEKPTIDLHYSRNSHHPQFHDEVRHMGLFDLIEMVCDWHAAWAVYESCKSPGKRMSWPENLGVNLARFDGFTDAQSYVISEIATWLYKQNR